jgi:hypothetical protein
VNACDEHGWTALIVAASYGYQDLVALLLSRGARADVQANNGMTALHLAAHYGFKGVAKLLVERDGHTVVHATAMYRMTPLHVACFTRHPDLARLLLRCGADVAAKDAHEKTALDYVGSKQERQALTLFAQGCPAERWRRRRPLLLLQYNSVSVRVPQEYVCSSVVRVLHNKDMLRCITLFS